MARMVIKSGDHESEEHICYTDVWMGSQGGAVRFFQCEVVMEGTAGNGPKMWKGKETTSLEVALKDRERALATLNATNNRMARVNKMPSSPSVSSLQSLSPRSPKAKKRT
mmetsp:Transcript_57192/g.100090  ORF Transcript_57192/g.100090 Transcript_57192/m.100090 type:complete len:110 (+) Transcript_57192:72-401(+)